MKNNRRGVSVLSIGIAITIMLIIVSTITFSVVDNLRIQKLDNLYNDIRILKEKVDIYYLKYGKLPLGEEDFAINNVPKEVLNVNDGGKYYKINLNALGNLSLNTEIDEKSYFVINEQSHTIYYPNGVEVNGDTYYALTETYVEIE